MPLLKPLVETYSGRRPARCARFPECNRKIRTGDSCVVLRKGSRLKSRFCSVECQEIVEDRIVNNPLRG